MSEFPQVVFGAVASATLMFAMPVFAGGEAGGLVLRDIGEKFVGYTTQPGENGSLNVTNAMFVQYMLPGLKGGGHFAMAQLDTAAYARVFIDLAKAIEKKAQK
jgi:hypothetical protein